MKVINQIQLTFSFAFKNERLKIRSPGVLERVHISVHAEHAAVTPTAAAGAGLPRPRPPTRRTGGGRRVAGPFHRLIQWQAAIRQRRALISGYVGAVWQRSALIGGQLTADGISTLAIVRRCSLIGGNMAADGAGSLHAAVAAGYAARRHLSQGPLRGKKVTFRGFMNMWT